MAARMETRVIRQLEELEELERDWLRLFEQSGVPNPFAHPGWLIVWTRRFTKPGELFVVTVRRNGELVAVAPFYYDRRRVLPGLHLSRLRLLGTAPRDSLTETPQILTAPDVAQAALRVVVATIVEHQEEWDWVDIRLTDRQGWFDLASLAPASSTRRYAVVPGGSDVYVVVPLEGGEESLKGSMKKGLRQTIRTSVNRLAKDGLEWEATRLPSGSGALEQGLEELIELNRARAERLPGRIQHRDVFSGDTEPFLREAAAALDADGRIALWGLSIEGRVVARLFGLTANRSVYILISGFDPSYWRYAPMTLLQWEALRECAGLGYEVANLATGVAPTKLRWSERLEVHNRFVLVGQRLRSRLAFAVFWQLRAASLLRSARAIAGNFPDDENVEQVAQMEERSSRRDQADAAGRAERSAAARSEPVASGG